MISIVTPTFPGREQVLMERCIPSVQKQRFTFHTIPAQPIQHIVVSDRNPVLRHAMTYKYPNVIFAEINEIWRNDFSESCTGAFPWGVGSLLAMGEVVGFLGDDDEYLSSHVQLHLQTMAETGADFTISEVQFQVDGVPKFVVGDNSFQLGHLDSDGIMCKVHCLKSANWSISDVDGNAADYRLVRDWRSAGLKGALVPGGPTAIHHDGWLAGKSGRPRE